MRRLALTFLIAAVCTPPAGAKVTLPKATAFTLGNGLAVRVVERHQLPLFTVKLTMKAGSVFDPTGKEGLASLTSDMLLRRPRCPWAPRLWLRPSVNALDRS